MTETSNIARAAEMVSNEIFKWFRWRVMPLRDSDWACALPHHNLRTHPADVVYQYNDPYSNQVVYMHTDLKSYAKGSITATSIGSALRSLSKAVECASVSEDWQRKFLSSDNLPFVVRGMLFIFNHDNEYDKSFSQLLDATNLDESAIPEKVRLVVLWPSRIRTLFNVALDIQRCIASNEFTETKYTFFYPDMFLSKRHGKEWEQSASFETLTGPWMIVKYMSPSGKEGYVVYYHMPGDSPEEFIYLLDALSHNQMLLSEESIRIRFTEPCDDAASHFARAREEYLSMWGSDRARRDRLFAIEARSLTALAPNYVPLEIGMRLDNA